MAMFSFLPFSSPGRVSKMVKKAWPPFGTTIVAYFIYLVSTLFGGHQPESLTGSGIRAGVRFRRIGRGSPERFE